MPFWAKSSKQGVNEEKTNKSKQKSKILDGGSDVVGAAFFLSGVEGPPKAAEGPRAGINWNVACLP